MCAINLITDPRDERISDYQALTDVELRTRWEPPNGLFIAEGELVLRRALRGGYRARSYLVDQKRVDQVQELITDPANAPQDQGAAAPAAPVYLASPEVLRQITGFNVHRGVLASFHRAPLNRAQDILAQSQRVVLLEDVNNHTNVGAIFRGAAALGFDAVLLSPSCADPLYRRSVRVSMGEVFAIPYARLDPWSAGLAAVRAAGFTLLALTPAADALPIQCLTSQQRSKPALLLGAEGPGLSPTALDSSDVAVSLPMRREVDSLNVAAAAAVAFWELCRDLPPSGSADQLPGFL